MDSLALDVQEEINTTGALSENGFARLNEVLTAFTARFLGQ